jgi:23S rRNA (pseudouridine1915-N3)-methyltransferase
VELLVLAVGKLKDPTLTALCDEWIVRSRSFLPIRRQRCRDADRQWSIARSHKGPIVAVDERGEQIDTPTLARWLATWRDTGARSVTFLIGDAHGHRQSDRASADRVLALSRLTFPHRLAEIVLCEQLYRAGTILAGHPYHHA